MAKCFQVVGQGVPVRMSNADAFQVVERDHDGEYCPKHLWKKERAREHGDNCLRKLDGRKIVKTETLHVDGRRSRKAW